ncbi:MAG: Co2+/Mg2+ efflux protein ApaG [Betaproteobacteria bacterium]|nr:Co2+/Mg2+ efflux protein ApaG [Betaproteobacteria bacterium]
MYRALTQSIEVCAEPSYLPAQSDPDAAHFVWAYRITITNQSQETVQLISRYWHITDELGRVQEVRGEGVVGEQPVLVPGQSHDYVSGCPLTTPNGSMEGHYSFEREDGTALEVAIPFFPLAAPATAD